MKQLAIIGASYLQAPLIQKAKDLGCVTHVFAWAADDVGEKMADHFYPISIIEKEEILQKCREIGIDGICTIASDLAAVTVNYVAEQMGLPGNGMRCCEKSTNKHKMREAFKAAGDPSPFSVLIGPKISLSALEGMQYPLIVKPTDRSGSRGITEVRRPAGLPAAIARAREQSFEKMAVVEEFAQGQEYSVECISCQGTHHLLQITLKYTTGAPMYIETGHMEPAPLTADQREKVRRGVFHAGHAGNSKRRVPQRTQDRRGREDPHYRNRRPYGRRLHRQPSGALHHGAGLCGHGRTDRAGPGP